MNNNEPTEKQWNKIITLIEFLFENNTYYERKFLYNKINPDNIKKSFKSIPIVTKKEIRNCYSDYISKTPESVLEELTSGSTGEPLKCLKTNNERLKASLILWLERKKHDKKVHPEKFFSLVGPKTFKEIGDFCDLSEENMKKCFEGMLLKKPRWICGPPTVIYQYARLIQNGVLKYDDKIIKFIELSGEYIDSHRRKYIEEVFNCRTLNQYGTRECWCIAYECKEGCLHVVENVYVETINQKKDISINGKYPGEIVITSLYNKLMPFIRYNIGDLGIVERKKCKCGVDSQIITLAGGRSGDIIKGKNSMLGDIFFKRVVNDFIDEGFDIIENFQVEQIAEKNFNFYIVPSETFSDSVIEFLTNIIINRLGYKVQLKYYFVESIPTSKTGKIKTFVSLI